MICKSPLGTKRSDAKYCGPRCKSIGWGLNIFPKFKGINKNVRMANETKKEVDPKTKADEPLRGR